jgi:hypothetical protein
MGSIIYFAFFFVSIVVAFAGFFVISQFSGGIKAMQADTERHWEAQDAVESKRIIDEKNKAAGGV